MKLMNLASDKTSDRSQEHVRRCRQKTGDASGRNMVASVSSRIPEFLMLPLRANQNP